MKKTNTSGARSKDLPVFELNAFSKKATWSDFYIQKVREHETEHSFIGRPHKHDFYLILFIEQGSGTHTIDFTQYQIQPKSIFLMTPGQVHNWTLSDDTDGFVIFFTREFYETLLSENSLLEFTFYHALAATPVVLPSQDEALKFAVHRMYEEYARVEKPDLRMLRAYLDIFLLEAARYYRSSSETTTGNTFKLRKLEQLIDAKFRTLKQPGEYARLMNIAPGYLNSICKEAVGKTVSELIQQRILLEAKRIFSYSDFHVNEVATRLGFSDPSYFTRWFRKQTHQTPDEFRRNLDQQPSG